MTPEEARTRREALNLSQRELADALEVHPPFGSARTFDIHKETISRYERGLYPIPGWYEDALAYVEKQHGLGPHQKVIVNFRTVITKTNAPRAKDATQW